MQTAPIDRLLPLLDHVKGHGTNHWMASSPTRRDSNPSLSITLADDGKVLLKDFGGSTFEEIVDALGIEPRDLFADDRKEGKPMRTSAPRKKTYQTPALPDDPTFREGATKWFAARGITTGTMTHFGIYTDNHYFRKTEKVGPAICIPYRKDGAVVNIKFRCPSVKDFAMVEDAEPCFYNLDALEDAAEVIVVEGEMDVFALYEAGITHVISPPNGCQSLTDAVMESAAHLFGDDRIRVILAGDMDEAGQRMMDDLARRIGRERCFKVAWPDGCKDANDTLLQYGSEAVAHAIERAEGYAVDGIVSIRDASEDLWKLYEGGMPPGTSTGIAALDRIYTIAPGQFTIVTGSPNSGKTTLIDNFIVNTGISHDWAYGICSLENLRVARHEASIAAKYIGKPFRDGYIDRMAASDLARAEAWMDEHVAFIRPREVTMEAILLAAKALVYQKGIKGVVIDPWNRIRHPQSMNNGDYVADALSRITEFADRFDVHVFLVAHPTKLQRGADGNYPVPTLADCSGSANFENMADYGLSVWRDRVDFTADPQVHCQKARFDPEIATHGKVTLGFDRATGKFFDRDASGDTASEGLMAYRPADPLARIYAKEATFAEIAAGN